MGTEEPMDPMKGMNWKSVINSIRNPSAVPDAVPGPVPGAIPSAGQAGKKRGIAKFRPLPDHYFIPRWSWPATLGFYGACIAGGIGAGMLGEIWIKKKIAEGDDVIWEFK